MLALLLTCALATTLHEESITLHHVFTEGQRINYTLHMLEHTENAEANVDAAYTEVVRQAAPDGSATLAANYTDYKVTANGMDIPAPAPAPNDVHVDAHGLQPLKELAAIGTVSHLMPDLLAGVAYNTLLKKGKDTSLSIIDPADPKNLVSGTLKYDKLEGDLITVECKFAIQSSSLDSPIVAEMTVVANATNGDLDHADGVLKALPSQLAGRYQVQTASFSVKRV